MSDMHLDLTDLLDQDLSSFEYFQTLSGAVKKKLMGLDIRSFRELQEEAEKLKRDRAR